MESRVSSLMSLFFFNYHVAFEIDLCCIMYLSSPHTSFYC